jgi:hypothetical protein
MDAHGKSFRTRKKRKKRFCVCSPLFPPFPRPIFVSNRVIHFRLWCFFGLSSGYWLRAQAAYDTEVAQEQLADVLDKIKPWQGAPRAGATTH